MPMWEGPVVLVHTMPAHFRELPVCIERLQVVLPLKKGYGSWDDARLRYFEAALAPGREL